MSDPVAVAIEHIEERGKELDTRLERMRRARERNEMAELKPYSDFQTLAAEGDKLAKEVARELLRKAGVSDETFELAWNTDP